MAEEIMVQANNNTAILTVPDIKARTALLRRMLDEALEEGVDYGKIPGCGDKPCLFQPGAQKLGVLYRLIPEFQITMREFAGLHREYEVRTRLTHELTGHLVAEGVGTATTLETKWRYQDARRKCPECGKEAIIKGKAEYGGGWLCFARKGGCGTKWPDGAAEIEQQDVGQTECSPPDKWNTVLKMGKKRSLIDATITATAASALLTQDLEEDAPTPEAPASAAAPNRDAMSRGPRPDKPAPTKPAGPPMTADQKAQLAALKKVLGPAKTGEIMRRLGFDKDTTIDTDAAAMLIDTLTSEAEARAAAQPAPEQKPAASQSPGDMNAPPSRQPGDDDLI